MKSSTKWGIGIGVVLLAIGVAAASTASAEDVPHQGGEAGVRHGIRYEGCSHFDLEDFEKLKAWFLDHKLKFAKWALRLEEVRANPEPALTETMSLLFPECPWPPPAETTFGPARVGWAEAIANAKEAIANIDIMSVRSGRDLNIANVLASILRARKR